MTRPKPDEEKAALVCNLCGSKRRDVRFRLQYPSFACNWCYRTWKREGAA